MFPTSEQGHGNTWEHIGNLSYDALFGSHYDSAKDEDYSEQEDFAVNKQMYKQDHRKKDNHLKVSKAEMEFLLQ
jgi:hypothetical protein